MLNPTQILFIISLFSDRYPPVRTVRHSFPLNQSEPGRYSAGGFHTMCLSIPTVAYFSKPAAVGGEGVMENEERRSF